MTNITLQNLIDGTVETKKKYARIPGENCHQRWDRVHIANWTEQIEMCDDIIEYFDALPHEELFEALKKGDFSLQWAYKRKAKFEALIAKYTEPDYVASRVGKMAVVKA
jgi:hypothetical protein